jgi:cobalt-precorrin-5B (C1)-methyltransferase
MTAKRNARKVLRRGFSTGTAATAAARAALRLLLSGESPRVVAVRLPGELWYPVAVRECRVVGDYAEATVIKDAGDDPDVTHRARIVARVCCSTRGPLGAGVLLRGGEGVGVATKLGLPVLVGEPAINPVPREMIRDNLQDELRGWGRPVVPAAALDSTPPERPGMALWLPFRTYYAGQPEVVVEVEISVPGGEAIAGHTLNPRLGIVGGISILGTTGIVKPFSHEAYQETIEAAMEVAAANGRDTIVLSTGGKSERFARSYLSELPEEAFIQIADFFAFSVETAVLKGFGNVVHSVFFGKAVKMAQGHAYTHAHRNPLELKHLAMLSERMGYDSSLCQELSAANTARHALEILKAREAADVITAVARRARKQSKKISRQQLATRLLLFDYDGTILADVRSADAMLQL